MGSADAAEFEPRVRAVEAACAEVGRDPATLRRSVGIVVAPLAAPGDELPVLYGKPTTGPADNIVAAMRSLREVGFSQVEVMLEPMTPAALRALGAALALADASQV